MVISFFHTNVFGIFFCVFYRIYDVYLLLLGSTVVGLLVSCRPILEFLFTVPSVLTVAL